MSETTTVYYKGMLENGLTRYERPGWHLPKGSRPGKWMPKQTPVLCESGYHVSTIDQLRRWIAPAIYVVEVKGAHVEDDSKSAWEQARLVRRIEGWGMAEMVEWAQKCAEHVAHLKNGRSSYASHAASYASAASAYASAASYASEIQWQTDLLKSMLGVDR